jgi:hypothetical protein
MLERWSKKIIEKRYQFSRSDDGEARPGGSKTI